ALFEYEDLDGAVVVCHSYGGSVTTAAAERLARRVKALVHIHAFVPKDGQATLQLFPDQIREAFKTIAQTRGEGWRLLAGEQLRQHEPHALLRRGGAGDDLLEILRRDARLFHGPAALLLPTVNQLVLGQRIRDDPHFLVLHFRVIEGARGNGRDIGDADERTL